MNDKTSRPGGTAALPLGFGDFLRFEKLVADRFGLHFSEKRRADLERGVRQAFAASPCSDMGEYYNLLMHPDRGQLYMEQLVNAITIGESYFFRNSAQFDALAQYVFPEIIQRRKALRTLRIWSAGCANGEEPYSIAILLRELIPDIDDWTVTILGTDINTEVLDRARKGLYSEWAFREERARQLRHIYFRQVNGRYQLIPEILRMVTFKPLNLAGPEYPAYETNTMFMDLILCRNVMIYFSSLVMQEAVNKFYDALVDTGWLVVGHSEHSLTIFQRYKVRNFPGAILYQRSGDPFGSTPAPVFPGFSVPPTASSTWPPVTLPPAPAAPPVLPPTPVVEKKPAPESKPLPPPPPKPPAAPPADPVEQAQELVERGRPEEALEGLLRYANRDMNSVPVCCLIGRLYADLGYWDLAEQWSQRAIELDRLCLPAYYTLALVYQHSGHLNQAMEMMKKVVYIDRQYILGHFTLAGLYHDLGQEPQALKSLENALRLLDMRAADDLLPDSGGVTVARLRQTIILQQQQWSRTK